MKQRKQEPDKHRRRRRRDDDELSNSDRSIAAARTTTRRRLTRRRRLSKSASERASGLASSRNRSESKLSAMRTTRALTNTLTYARLGAPNRSTGRRSMLPVVGVEMLNSTRRSSSSQQRRRLAHGDHARAFPSSPPTKTSYSASCWAPHIAMRRPGVIAIIARLSLLLRHLIIMSERLFCDAARIQDHTLEGCDKRH